MSEEKNPVRRIGIDKARRELGPLVDGVAAGNGPIEITRRGKVLAVLVDAGDWNLHRSDQLYQEEQAEKELQHER